MAQGFWSHGGSCLTVFCAECKSLLKPGPDGPVCPDCGAAGEGGSQLITASDVADHEVPVFEDDHQTLPTSDEYPCPECGNREAYFQYRQTRAADEPTTIILQCTECKHKWRKY